VKKIFSIPLFLIALSLLSSCSGPGAGPGREPVQAVSSFSEKADPPSSIAPESLTDTPQELSESQTSSTQETDPANSGSPEENFRETLDQPPAGSQADAKTAGSSGEPEDVSSMAGYKELKGPDTGEFSLQEAFRMAGITESSEIASVLIADMADSADISDPETIQTLWEMMGATGLVNDGIFGNPDTGGSITLTFHFSDGTTAAVHMMGYVQLNGEGHYNFTNDSAGQPYAELLYALC
jgi:hypothetical protein